MPWFVIVVVAVAALIIVVPLGLKELARWDRNRHPIGLKLFKVGYWTVAVRTK